MPHRVAAAALDKVANTGREAGVGGGVTIFTVNVVLLPMGLAGRYIDVQLSRTT